MGEYQLELKEQNRLLSSNVKKLLQTLIDKKNYVLHYKLLKLYVSLGLIVAKVHRVLQFKQANWLAPYITLNSNKRQAASNKFEENFYKLMTMQYMVRIANRNADEVSLSLHEMLIKFCVPFQSLSLIGS